MPSPLPIERIEWTAEFAEPFETTDDLDAPPGIVGQRRAVDAIAFGLAMSAEGYNLFVMGREGSGRRKVTTDMISAEASTRPAPTDWCYVDNFADQRRPQVLRLERGLGRHFRDRMAKLVADLQESLRSAFQGEDYRSLQQLVEQEFKEKTEETLESIDKAARADDLALLRTPMGFAFAPIKDDKVVPPEAMSTFTEERRAAFAEAVKKHETALQHALRAVPTEAYSAREKMRALNRETATGVVDFLLAGVKEEFGKDPDIMEHLVGMRGDIVKNVELIISELDAPRANSLDELLNGHPFYRRYLVNLFVDHTDCNHAPVVYEDEPSLDRLMGTVEHRAEMGTLQTDFHLIRPGTIHLANGGYLVVDARKVLTMPLVYEALKRALSSHEVRIESMAQALGYLPTNSLEPEPIPLDVKVVLIGERQIFYALSALDPEFDRLFKIVVDFDDTVEVSGAVTADAYARLVASVVKSEKLVPFSRAAVERVLWQAAREAADRRRFTTQLRRVNDLVREASHCARARGATVVDASTVDQAISAQIDRIARVPELMQTMITERTIAIDTDGAAIGQINGLTVSQIGALSFGRPARITARISLGKGDVVDIEREVELGGPIHSKGVLILSNYLRSTFGVGSPLSLHASLVFEQSYGGVDGDSASLAEACALISAISGAPIDQSFAVTGSINQMGHVQAIGGVNEKIEGFFDICRANGLTGRQGVLIPATNINHLVLAERVVDGIREGRFAIHAVSSVAEAAELLMAVPAGAARPDGSYPDDSLFGRVSARLRDFDTARRNANAKLDKDIS